MSNNANKQPENSQAKQNTAQISIPCAQAAQVGQFNRDPNSFRQRPPTFHSNNFQQRQQRPWYSNNQNNQNPRRNFGGNQRLRGPRSTNGWYYPVHSQQPGMNRQQNQYYEPEQQSQQHMLFTWASQIVCHYCGYPNHKASQFAVSKSRAQSGMRFPFNRDPKN